jgi:glutaredoxin 3
MSEKAPNRPRSRKPAGASKPKPKSHKPVALFTAPGCSWCTTAKKYLKDKGIRFRTIDISKDAKAAKDCQRHGCRGVPVVLIGTRWICGFDKKTIDKELGIS